MALAFVLADSTRLNGSGLEQRIFVSLMLCGSMLAVVSYAYVRVSWNVLYNLKLPTWWRSASFIFSAVVKTRGRKPWALHIIDVEGFKYIRYLNFLRRLKLLLFYEVIVSLTFFQPFLLL